MTSFSDEGKASSPGSSTPRHLVRAFKSLILASLSVSPTYLVGSLQRNSLIAIFSVSGSSLSIKFTYAVVASGSMQLRSSSRMVANSDVSAIWSARCIKLRSNSSYNLSFMPPSFWPIWNSSVLTLNIFTLFSNAILLTD